MITKAQIHGPTGNADYMRQDSKRGDLGYVMSRSELKNFAVCPSRWLAGYKSESTDSTSWGDMLDCLLLTPEQFGKRFVVAPATYPAKESTKKDAKIIQKPWRWTATYCKEWRDDLPNGATSVTSSEVADLMLAVTRINSDPEIVDLLKCSQFQVLGTATWQDKETGIAVPLKIMADIVPDQFHPSFGKTIADLKSCASAHPAVWEKEVDRYWYDAQAALYLDLFCATGEDRCDFRHVLSENYSPFQTAKRFLTTEYIEVGRMKYQNALTAYCRCLKTDVWPDYDQAASQSKMRLNGGWLEASPGPYVMQNL